MRIRRSATIATMAATTAVAFTGVEAVAQQRPAIRQLGAVERISTDSLSSVAAALPMPGGRVLVNDITARRLLLFDSTLAHPLVVADTTSATANAYGVRAGTLIRYRGDTAMFMDIGSLSMLVVDPMGKIARVMAVPRPADAQNLIGSVFGTPGFDAGGRLVYYGNGGIGDGGIRLCCLGSIRVATLGSLATGLSSDSAFVVRADLAARTIDTAVVIKIIKTTVVLTSDANGMLTSIRTTHYPLPIVDDWVVTPDGSLAVVRGRDYHVDWLDGSGHWTSFPKMPFDWEHVDDGRKQALIDSTAKAEADLQARMDAQTAAARPTSTGGGRGGGNGGGRGGGNGGGGGSVNPLQIPNITAKAAVAELPDYAPAFVRGALTADADGNLWIRTTTMVAGRPVYDIVNRHGELVDRVQLPPFRTIAGFGAGVVYLAVKDTDSAVHLERARIR